MMEREEEGVIGKQKGMGEMGFRPTPTTPFFGNSNYALHYTHTPPKYPRPLWSFLISFSFLFPLFNSISHYIHGPKPKSKIHSYWA